MSSELSQMPSFLWLRTISGSILKDGGGYIRDQAGQVIQGRQGNPPPRCHLRVHVSLEHHVFPPPPSLQERSLEDDRYLLSGQFVL